MCLHPLVASHRSKQASTDVSTVRHFFLPLPQPSQLQKAESLSIGLYIFPTSLTRVQLAGGVPGGVGAVVDGGGATAAKAFEPQTVFFRHDFEARDTFSMDANVLFM
jgi:hypothetical protein